MNQKAQEYKKRLAKTQSAQQQLDVNKFLQQQQQMLTGLAMKLFELENRVKAQGARLDTTQATSRYADYRSNALETLLLQSGTYTENDVLFEIEKLQIADFNQNSAIDDQRNGLTDAGNGPAETGMQAIVMIKLYKDGQELTRERVVRSKFELGKNELGMAGLDEAVTGLMIGESKKFALNLQDKTDEAEVFVLGLRKKAEVHQQQEAQAETTEQSGSGQ